MALSMSSVERGTSKSLRILIKSAQQHERDPYWSISDLSSVPS